MLALEHCHKTVASGRVPVASQSPRKLQVLPQRQESESQNAICVGSEVGGFWTGSANVRTMRSGARRGSGCSSRERLRVALSRLCRVEKQAEACRPRPGISLLPLRAPQVEATGRG